MNQSDAPLSRKGEGLADRKAGYSPVGEQDADNVAPMCPTNPAHGYMELRPLTNQTKEQQWCGVWYDCREAHCRSSVLYQSKELKAQLAEQMHRIKADFLALRGKRQRERFLSHCAPSVAQELRGSK